MNEELLTLIKEQLPKLPESVALVFQNPETTLKIEDIARYAELSDDEAQKLDLEVALLLLGLTNPQKFREVLSTQIGVDQERLEAIAKLLNEEILNPIYGDLLHFYEEDQKTLQEVAQQNAEQEAAVPSETPQTLGEKLTGAAPDDLPTDGELPDHLTTPEPVSVPTPEPEVPLHAFEAKMKQVFTAGTPERTTLELESNTQTSAPNPAPQIDVARVNRDPYREPIEL